VEEAAEALGISRHHFERHVMDDVRIIYCGPRRLVPIGELERWANRTAVALPRTRWGSQ
jgi:hypothetical protein